MILSASQPYFAPFPAYFLKIMLSDVFVLLDDVQFPRGTTWITRNRFKNDQGTLWVTIPVWKKGLGLQKISDVKICPEGRWGAKHLASLKTAYKNSPYFESHLDFIENLFNSHFQKIAQMNISIIDYILQTLDIKTKVVRLSTLGISSRGNRLIADLCRKMEAATFLAQSPAKKYLDPDFFRSRGIALSFFTPPSPVYPQLWGDFISNLSIFDLLFNCGPKSKEIIRFYQK